MPIQPIAEENLAPELRHRPQRTHEHFDSFAIVQHLIDERHRTGKRLGQGLFQARLSDALKMVADQVTGGREAECRHIRDLPRGLIIIQPDISLLDDVLRIEAHAKLRMDETQELWAKAHGFRQFARVTGRQRCVVHFSIHLHERPSIMEDPSRSARYDMSARHRNGL